MQSGAYSSRFKVLQKEQIHQMKKEYQEEDMELTARNHRLHIETNRRRKAYALKKKTQAQREERRRQLILAKRKQLIQDATEKFQRLNRSPVPVQNVNPLKDGNNGPKYTLDEALRLISGHEHCSSAPIQSDPDLGGSIKQPASVPADMRSDSRRGLTSSRTLFEQQLTQHQQMLANQQKMALKNFSEAVIVGNITPKNSIAKTGDDQLSASSRQLSQSEMVDSLDVVKESSSHRPDSLEQPTFNKGMEKNSTKSQDMSKEWNLQSGNPRNEAKALSGKENHGMLIQNRGYFSLNSANTFSTADCGSSKTGSVFNVDTRSAKDLNQNKAANGRPGFPDALIGLLPVNVIGPVPISAAAQSNHPSRAINFGGTGYGAGTEPVSTGPFILHHGANNPSPNVAIVQPNCHSNAANSNTEWKQTAAISKFELPQTVSELVEKEHLTNHLPLEERCLRDGEVADANQINSLTDAVVMFTSSQTAPDPGTFFVSSGLPLTAKTVVDNTCNTEHRHHQVTVSEASSHNNETTFNNYMLPFNKLTDVDQGNLSTYPVKANVQNKPPTGKVKSAGEMIKQDLPLQDLEKQGMSQLHDVGNGHQEANRLQNSKVEFLGQGLQQMAIGQTTGSGLQTTHHPNNTLQNIKVPQNNPQILIDEVYSEGGSSNMSSSNGKPVSRIPVPSSLLAKTPKGILKRPSSCLQQPDSGHNEPSGLMRSASTGAMSVSLRDSLEVMKQHRRGEDGHRDAESNQKSGKKSVRFAEVLCEEAPDQAITCDAPLQPDAEKVLFYPRPPLQEKVQAALTRPMRPISAKVISTTPPVDPDVKIPRVASAGVMRRGPFYNPTVPSNSSLPASTNNRGSTQPSSSTGNQPIGGGNPSMASTANGRSDTEKPTRDISGISLDKTPTEEEINWLWQKVRSCLNRRESSPAATAVLPNGTSVSGNTNGVAVTVNSNCVPPARQTVQVSCTNFDGNSLAVTRPSLGKVSNTYVNNYMGNQYPVRRRITMETLNAYTKKTTNNLLQQRKAVQPNTVPVSYPLLQTSEYVPVNGVAKPDVSQSAKVTAASRNPVSESMAAFLAAEDLTHYANLDDSIIANVMDAAERRARSMINTNSPSTKIPSALSLEEERLMKSIDRLNEKLTANQQPANQPVLVSLVPKPPPPYNATRNRQTMFSGRRMVTYSGTVPRHYFLSSGTASAVNGPLKHAT